MHLSGIPASGIHWLRELQLRTVGLSHPAIVDCFLAGDRASGHVKGCSIGDSPIHTDSYVEPIYVQSAYWCYFCCIGGWELQQLQNHLKYFISPNVCMVCPEPEMLQISHFDKYLTTRMRV